MVGAVCYSTLVVVIFTSVCWSQVTLITRPLNHVIKTGQTVVFRCELSQQSELGAEIEWFECITYDNGTCRLLSTNSDVVYGGPEDRKARYKIVRSDMEYNLTITAIKLTDAGRYRCRSILSPVMYGDAQLIVINNDPLCSVDNDKPVLRPDDVINLNCLLQCAGLWTPVMRWFQDGERYTGKVVNASLANIVRHAVPLAIEARHNGAVYSVEIDFPEPVIKDDQHADNTLEYSFNFTFPELLVHFEPYETTISPDDEQYWAGESLSCSSLANPPPGYSWTNERTGSSLANTSILTVTADMVGCHMFTCHASNQYGTEHAMTSVFLAGEKPLTISLWAFVVVLTVLIMSLIANIVLVRYMCRRLRKGTRQPAGDNRARTPETGITGSGGTRPHQIVPVRNKPITKNLLSQPRIQLDSTNDNSHSTNDGANPTATPTRKRTLMEERDHSAPTDRKTMPADLHTGAPRERKALVPKSNVMIPKLKVLTPPNGSPVSPIALLSASPGGQRVLLPEQLAVSRANITPEPQRHNGPAEHKSPTPRVLPKPQILAKYEQVGDREPAPVSSYDSLNLQPSFPAPLGTKGLRPARSEETLTRNTDGELHAAQSSPSLTTSNEDGYEEVEFLQ